MNEEEKKIINDLKNQVNEPLKADENYVDTFILVNIKECKQIVNLIEKQQKEIKARLEEIDSLYKMMSAKDNEIEELRHFKEEVIDIIENAYYTAEPTYCNIKNLIEKGE